MLRASALIYSVIFSILILIITLFLISTLYDSQINFIKLKRIERANDNLQSAIQLIMSSASTYPNTGDFDLDIYKDGNDMAYINISKWGLVDLYNIICPVGKDTLRKSFLLGYEPDKNYAINITATDRILNIGGHTSIKGNAYIPSGILKRAYIEGRGNLLSNAVSGETKSSPYNLSFDLQKLKQQVGAFILSTQDKSDDIGGQQNSRSFTANEQVIFFNTTINLSSQQIKGHYIIKSDSKIFIQKNTNLEDIILIAPEIAIEEGFEGTLQCFATNKIAVGNRVRLKYPSALCIKPDSKADSLSCLSIGEDGIIAGQIIAFNNKSRDTKTMVEIQKGVKFYGQIFSEGNTQLNGFISGNIQTGSFFLKTTSAIYDNTILDAEINCNDLDKNYYSLVRQFNGKKKYN